MTNSEEQMPESKIMSNEIAHKIISDLLCKHRELNSHVYFEAFQCVMEEFVAAFESAYAAGQRSKVVAMLPSEEEIEKEAILASERTCWPGDIYGVVLKNYLCAFNACAYYLRENVQAKAIEFPAESSVTHAAASSEADANKNNENWNYPICFFKGAVWTIREIKRLNGWNKE